MFINRAPALRPTLRIGLTLTRGTASITTTTMTTNTTSTTSTTTTTTTTTSTTTSATTTAHTDLFVCPSDQFVCCVVALLE